MTRNPGRGRGRGRGRRFGRGGRSYQNNHNTFQNIQSRSEIKFYPHNAGRQQSITFSRVKDEIIGMIRRTYEYGSVVAQALEDEIPFDYNTERPTIAVSTATDEAQKKIEDRQNDKIFDAEVEV